MSSNTDRLEREAESHRTSLDATFDAIRNRLSVGQIVDEFTGYLKEGQGADTVKNLGRQVRDNPLALAVVGAGLTWLFMGNGVRADSGNHANQVARPQDGMPRSFNRPPDAHDRPTATERARFAGAQNDPTGPFASKSTSEHSDAAGRLSHAADSAKDVGSRTASGAKDTLKDAAHTVSDTAGTMWDSTASGMHGAAAMGSDAGHSVMDGARQTGRDAFRAGARAQRGIGDLIQQEPLVFGAVALAIGAAVGAMLPATRTEDEWMGETRDQVRDDAYSQGEELVDSAKAVVAESYDAASETAEDKGLKPGSKDAGSETVAEKVTDVAKAATDTAKDAAKAEGLR